MVQLLSLLLPVVFAKSISTPYLNFEVPNSYTCTSEDAYYQCQDTTGPRMKDSIFIVTFKRAGAQDTLEHYKTLLSRPFSRTNKSGPPSLSQVLSSSQISINGWNWVQAKHFESDLSNYYTYHWATVRGPVAMVAKYSVLKSADQSRQNDIRQIASSFDAKLVQFAPALAQSPNGQLGASGAGPAAPTAASGALESLAGENSKNGFSQENLMKNKKLFIFVGALLLVMAGGFAYFKN